MDKAGVRATHPFPDLNLQIMGIGVEYPELRIDANFLRDYASKFYPSTPAYVPRIHAMFASPPVLLTLHPYVC